MKKTPTPRPRLRRPSPATVRLLAAGALPAAALAVLLSAPRAVALLADDAGARPIRIDPREGRSGALDLPRGGQLLVAFLQQVADASGEVIYIAPDVAPGHEVELGRATRGLDVKGLQEVLRASGLIMSRERYLDEDVYWVRRLLERPSRKRGSIVRPEAPEDAADEEAPRRAPSRGADAGAGRGWRTPRERLEPTAHGDVRVFQRVDGERSSWLVTFETGSRAEAEEVARTLGLILADREGRK